MFHLSLNSTGARARRFPLLSVIGCATAVLSLALIAAGEPATRPARESENLISNGDFETPTAEDRHLALTKDQLDGWTVERGDVDVVSTYWPAKRGVQSLDLNGMTSGVISQKIDTRPGQWYRLAFAYSGNPDENAVDKERAAEVQWGDKRIATLHPTLGTLENMNWQQAEYFVQAKGDHTTLLFISITDGKYGVTLDDISLTACDPPAAPPTTRSASETKKDPTTSPFEKTN